MIKSKNVDARKSIDVLKFWRAIEYFVPFDLDEITARLSAQYVLTENQLIERGNHHLPWLSKFALTKAGCDSTYEYKYYLYLLPFNKNELTQISQQVFPFESDPVKTIEHEEKFDDEGETCFARLSLDNEGHFDSSNISISTLPWAIGRLANYDLDALNSINYDIEQQKLKSELDLLLSHLNNPKSEIITDYEKPGILTALGLRALLTILKCWANFSPNHPFAVVIDHVKIPPKKNENSTNKLIEKINIKQPGFKQSNAIKELSLSDIASNKTINLVNENKNFLESVDGKDEIGNLNVDSDNSIDILNSFYIEDLEKIINSLSNQKHVSLEAYILGCDNNKKIDIYSKDNNHYITHKLQPEYINHGRWPHDNKHIMSFMQQFAINECFHPTNGCSLFSVNGPPGTGKTTLLQDIMAENIVKRARALSEFRTSFDTFKEKISINFTNNDSRTIGVLDDRLTGYEMVVVSSNNAAIENITKELPLKSKISESFHSICHYLTPVISKIVAEHSDNQVKALPSKDIPWGLISIALGNSKNRNKFHEHAFFAPEGKEKSTERISAGEYLTIWEWKNQYKGYTFSEARQNFLSADKALNNYLISISRLSQIHQEIISVDINSYCKNDYSKIHALEIRKNILNNCEKELNTLFEKINQDKVHVHLNLQQHNHLKPSLFHRLFRTSIAKIYRNQLNTLRREWNNLLNRERMLKKENEKNIREMKLVTKEIDKLYEIIEHKKQGYIKLKNEYLDLLQKLENIILPPDQGDLDDKNIQLNALWQNEKLNELRTELFISALNLHEAWLYEVLKNGQFTGNLYAISNLLTNKRPVIVSHELLIWQSLFMWVPVISSTFASVARQFKNLDSETLGWFFIDEAGQAIPQAAIGALWRAKQTIVVGDPLQIEPVFTTPPNLVEGLARHMLQCDYDKWLPTLTLVQSLADNANVIGAYTYSTGKKQWIGSPLRVHRRCLDPMFSIANQIAYDNKMINARVNDSTHEHSKESFEKYPLGNSCWYNVVGDTTDKQFVLAQGKWALYLFAKLYEIENKLPDIYIITPFKCIKRNLQFLIEDINNWKHHIKTRHFMTQLNLPHKQILKKWCMTHIGTVHTFQGKESQTVIVVLGVDHTNQGAANWASSKPNLLNVALTRAKDRIYFIGDHHLWSRKRYFSELSQALPIVNVETEALSA